MIHKRTFSFNIKIKGSANKYHTFFVFIKCKNIINVNERIGPIDSPPNKCA